MITELQGLALFSLYTHLDLWNTLAIQTRNLNGYCGYYSLYDRKILRQKVFKWTLKDSFSSNSSFFLLRHRSICICCICISTHVSMWGCRIVWCNLTSRYLVSLLPVSIIHVSDIFLVGFWSWEISFIMWGCRGWGWQGAGTWVLVKWWDSPPPLGDVEPANQYAPSKKPARELKSPRAPKFEQKPAPFVPIELL